LLSKNIHVVLQIKRVYTQPCATRRYLNLDYNHVCNGNAGTAYRLGLIELSLRIKKYRNLFTYTQNSRKGHRCEGQDDTTSSLACPLTLLLNSGFLFENCPLQIKISASCSSRSFSQKLKSDLQLRLANIRTSISYIRSTLPHPKVAKLFEMNTKSNGMSVISP